MRSDNERLFDVRRFGRTGDKQSVSLLRQIQALIGFVEIMDQLGSREDQD